MDPPFRFMISASVMGPPPKASNSTLKPNCLTAAAQSFSQSPCVTTTCCAPSLLRRSACSWRRTTLRRGMPSVRQNLLSMRPRAEAAAVWMIPLCPGKELQSSVMPTTVRGLTMPEAAVATSTSSSITNAFSGLVTANSPHDPDPSSTKLTRFPTHSCRPYPFTSTTRPVPSSPIVAGRGTGKQWPPTLMRSEGFTVDASTWTRSCPYLGEGLGKSSQTGSLPYSCATSALCVAIKYLILSPLIPTFKSSTRKNKPTASEINKLQQTPPPTPPLTPPSPRPHPTLTPPSPHHPPTAACLI